MPFSVYFKYVGTYAPARRIQKGNRQNPHSNPVSTESPASEAARTQARGQQRFLDTLGQRSLGARSSIAIGWLALGLATHTARPHEARDGGRGHSPQRSTSSHIHGVYSLP